MKNAKNVKKKAIGIITIIAMLGSVLAFASCGRGPAGDEENTQTTQNGQETESGTFAQIMEEYGYTVTDGQVTGDADAVQRCEKAVNGDQDIVFTNCVMKSEDAAEAEYQSRVSIFQGEGIIGAEVVTTANTNEGEEESKMYSGIGDNKSITMEITGNTVVVSEYFVSDEDLGDLDDMASMMDSEFSKKTTEITEIFTKIQP